jgi:hypothetical protein
MVEYKPNSNKYKKQQEAAAKDEKKVEKVVSGVVRTKKKNEMQKLADVFISEDISNVGSYVLMDVLVPAIKKAVSDIITNGVDMILYGGSGGKSRGGSQASKISYRSYYDRSNDRRPINDIRTRTRYSYDNIVLDNRGEAEEVLYRMDELVEKYGLVSVADLYDLVGISHDYTDNNYGWTNLGTACVVRVQDGYMLKLPRARAFD